MEIAATHSSIIEWPTLDVCVRYLYKLLDPDGNPDEKGASALVCELADSLIRYVVTVLIFTSFVQTKV